MRPTLARISSVRSGFFFCGMALDPVENASGRVTNPNSAVAKSVISSAKRLRCKPTNVSACRYSRMKSRSLVASMELAVGAVNPSSRAAIVRSSASVAPATAPDPSGQKFSRAAQSQQAIGIAQRHLHIRQQPMRDEHRLGPLQVRVARHHSVAGVARLLDQRSGPRGEAVDDKLDLRAHIEAQVGGNLFVAAAAGVQLESERADALRQLEFDEVMNVLGGGVVAHLRLARVRCELRGDRVQRLRATPLFQLWSGFLPRQRADACALLAAISSSRSRQSKTMERCHASNSASSGSRKRPDHILPDCCSFDIALSVPHAIPFPCRC